MASTLAYTRYPTGDLPWYNSCQIIWLAQHRGWGTRPKPRRISEGQTPSDHHRNQQCLPQSNYGGKKTKPTHHQKTTHHHLSNYNSTTVLRAMSQTQNSLSCSSGCILCAISEFFTMNAFSYVSHTTLKAGLIQLAVEEIHTSHKHLEQDTQSFIACHAPCCNAIDILQVLFMAEYKPL